MKRNVLPSIQKYSPLIFKGVPHLKEGSALYDEFWEEQEYYCKHGFKPHGMDKISGYHYVYLNFWPIKLNDPNASKRSNRKISQIPFYRDQDHIYFSALDECKSDGEGLIVVKARDKGFSYMNSVAVGTEFTFYPYNEVGIAAGLEKTAASFYSKVEHGLENMPAPFRLNTMTNNAEEIESGYEIKQNGRYEKGGYRSKMYIRTVNNPGVFKGERLGFMMFEEAGEINKLLEAYIASEPCFRDGDDQFGLPVIGGTGGDIEKSSKDFKAMWYNHSAFNLRQLFIPANYAYKGFFSFESGESDVENAKNKILSDRKKIENSGDIKALNLHIQNYPLNAEEAFLKTTNGKFNLNIINRQRNQILAYDKIKNKIHQGRLEWDDRLYSAFFKNLHPDLKIGYRINHEPKVRFVPDPRGKVFILDGHFPILKEDGTHKYNGLDIGGIDSYDQDETGTAGSFGSAMIYRRFLHTGLESDLPVAYYCDRTQRASQFYENSLKLNIFYGARAMIEYSNLNIFKAWEQWKAFKYMAPRPTSVISPESKTRNRYGVRMSTDVKSNMEILMAEELDLHGDKIWFLPLLDDLADFGERNVDIGMSYGLCILHKIELSNKQIYQEQSKNEYIMPGSIRQDDPHQPTVLESNGIGTLKNGKWIV